MIISQNNLKYNTYYIKKRFYFMRLLMFCILYHNDIMQLIIDGKETIMYVKIPQMGEILYTKAKLFCGCSQLCIMFVLSLQALS